MPRTYVLDTNAIIYYTGDETVAVSKLQPILSSSVIIVPSIVVTELWSGKRASPEEMENIEFFLSTVFVMPLDASIAKSAGIFRRDYHPDIGDCIIAATALAMNAAVLTRNIRDFKRIPGLSVEAI